MESISPYIQIIGASLIIIISYFFNRISRKTNLPSVLLLIILGVLIHQGLIVAGVTELNYLPALEILGIVGLIMIVLEAALDLELKKEKWPIIWKSSTIAILSLGGASLLIAYIIKFFLNVDFYNALVYAVPISIMSSAIVIPSVGNLDEKRKEFMIYESTMSDIFGIMYFSFLVGSMDAETSTNLGWSIAGNIVITVLISVIVSYALIFLFQSIRSQVKLFLLIAVLLLLYTLGKMMHLSSLLIILVFGLILHNHKAFFFGFLKRFKNETAINDILKNFKMITAETAFVVRTFFFVIFGASITLTSLISFNVLIISLLIILVLFGVRLLFVKAVVWKDIFPVALIAPRGLITILLFFKIPKELKIAEFDTGILLFVIIVSSIVMAISLIRHAKKIDAQQNEILNN